MTCFNTFLNSLPPIFVVILVTWSYYSYVVQFCVFFLISVAKKTTYIFIYHVLLVMFLWSFLQTMWKHHEPVPEEYHLGSSEHTRLLTFSENEANSILKRIISLRRLEIHTCAQNGRIRYCKTCMVIKPDRAHHCRTCGKCILKMDHHCPWVANCVGFSNYKQFLLTLLYSTAWSFFYAGTVAEYITEIWKDFQNNITKLMIGIGFVMASMAGLLVAVLFVYHVGLVCRNETTLEALRELTFREDNLTYDIGKWRNFTEVFGDNICCWLLPIQTGRGNGYEFSVTNLIT